MWTFHRLDLHVWMHKLGEKREHVWKGLKCVFAFTQKSQVSLQDLSRLLQQLLSVLNAALCLQLSLQPHLVLFFHHYLSQTQTRLAGFSEKMEVFQLSYLFSNAKCAESFSGITVQMFLGLHSDVTVDILIILQSWTNTVLFRPDMNTGRGHASGEWDVIHLD